MSGIFKKASKILKRGGKFVFSLDHPFFYAGELKHSGNKNYFIVRNYFRPKKLKWYWYFQTQKKKIKFYSYHRTLQSIIDSLLKNGFRLERIVESKPEKSEGKVGLIVPLAILFATTKV